jgi:CelD/BcsL family acetyltransferase involved in cellulose biosynthesis
MPTSSQTQVRSPAGEPAVERHDRIATIAPEWDELADRLGAPPFLRPGWTEVWLDAFPGMTTTILAVREGGQLKAVLPLLRGRALLTSPANSHTPLSGSLADGADAARALARSLLEMRAPRTDLRSLDPGDPLLAELRAAARELGLPTIERVTDREPYVLLAGGFEAYEAGLARKYRKELRRMHRRLCDEGEVAFEFADGSERLDSLLEEGFAIEGSGWKSEQGSAIALAPDVRRFYTEIARWAAGRGWLRLAFLRLDGRPLAFDFCIEAGGAFYALKGGYDVEYRRFGPGSLLTFESLRRAFADGLNTYEFLGTDDPYKLNWTDATRDRVRLQTFSRSPTGRVQHTAWRFGRPLVKGAQARLGQA